MSQCVFGGVELGVLILGTLPWSREQPGVSCSFLRACVGWGGDGGRVSLPQLTYILASLPSINSGKGGICQHQEEEGKDLPCAFRRRLTTCQI